MLCNLNITSHKTELDIFIVDDILLGNVKFFKCFMMENFKHKNRDKNIMNTAMHPIHGFNNCQ